MTWHRPGDKPLSEPMMVRLVTHICATRPTFILDRVLNRYFIATEVIMQLQLAVTANNNRQCNVLFSSKVVLISYNIPFNQHVAQQSNLLDIGTVSYKNIVAYFSCLNLSTMQVLWQFLFCETQYSLLLTLWVNKLDKHRGAVFCWHTYLFYIIDTYALQKTA